MTAWWTAAVRARESQRDDRLFEDRWAATLVGRQGMEEYDRARAAYGPSTEFLYSTITRFFDDFLIGVTEMNQVQQVVLVAAGLDTRAFRLSWPPRTRVFELDQPHVIAYKDNQLSLMGAAPGCERHAIGVNLNAPWEHLLRNEGFNPSQPSVWVLEGFLYFLPQLAALDLLVVIASLASAGSCLGVDLVNGEMLTSPSTRHWSERMAAVGAPWLFTVDEPETLLAECGWSAVVVEPGEEGADFGRSPYPVTASAKASSARTFLVTASRLQDDDR